MVWGAPNQRMASELDVMEQTVKDHINAIFRKLGQTPIPSPNRSWDRSSLMSSGSCRQCW